MNPYDMAQQQDGLSQNPGPAWFMGGYSGVWGFGLAGQSGLQGMANQWEPPWKTEMRSVIEDFNRAENAAATRKSKILTLWIGSGALAYGILCLLAYFSW